MKSTNVQITLRAFFFMLTILITLMFANHPLSAQTPDATRTALAGASEGIYGRRVVSHDSGNTFAVGNFQGSSDSGTIILKGTDETKNFVVKLTKPLSGWQVPITITSSIASISRTFGGDPNATDGFDSGLDVPAAPPGMTYYAYFDILQFPNFLMTDIRTWIEPYQSEIIWTLRVVNATTETSTLSWDPANLPSQGTFTLEGSLDPIDMRAQNSVSFTGDKILMIRYQAAAITVTSPNGNELWGIGSTHDITWTSTNFTDPVKIEYSTDGGTTWLSPPIVNNTPNDGSHPWTIPNTPSTTCKVRISDAVDGTPWDASDNVFTIGEAVDIWPPADTSGTVNSIVDIPIYVRDVTNKGIFGVSLIVNTLPDVIEPLGAITEGTIVSPWGTPIVSISGGDIVISLAGTSPLIGDGKQVLIYIRYQVGNTLEAESPIIITQAMFNEGQPIAHVTNNGKFKIMSTFNISGKVSYYNNAQSVPQALISLTGYGSKSTYTDDMGSYQFTDLPGGNYVLKSTKDNDVRNAISPFDASLILRYAVGSVSLTPYQMLASDVSGNGQVTSFDASYILRYSVGLVSQFPIGKDWALVPTNFPINETNWSTAPDSLEYKPLNSNQNDQNFVGIVYGDASGNWSGASGTGSGVTVDLETGQIHQTGDGNWHLPIEIQFFDVAYSGSFKIFFDKNKWQFESSSIVNLTNDIISETAGTYGGVNFAFASGQSLNNQILQIKLLFKGLTTPSSSDIIIDSLVIDDELAKILSVQKNSEDEIPTTWHLNQNHPNPFNAETIIGYQIPKASHVNIEVFNLVGQLLRTLVNEMKNPGTYQVIWNGMDEQGLAVGSGIYIYRMSAGEFTAIKKMVLVQ